MYGRIQVRIHEKAWNRPVVRSTYRGSSLPIKVEQTTLEPTPIRYMRNGHVVLDRLLSLPSSEGRGWAPAKHYRRDV